MDGVVRKHYAFLMVRTGTFCFLFVAYVPQVSVNFLPSLSFSQAMFKLYKAKDRWAGGIKDEKKNLIVDRDSKA